MKNILFVHQSGEMYGSDKVLLYLVTEIVRHKNFYPIVVLPEHGPLAHALAENGAEVHIGEVLKVGRSTFTIRGIIELLLKLWSSFGGLSRIVGGREICVVHSNTLAVLGGALWARIRRVPHVWHVHELVESPRFVGRFYAALLSCAADMVICNSSATRAWLLDNSPRLAPKCCVVFNGQPSVPPRAASNGAIDRFGVPPGSVVFSLVGRINRWKGHSLLVDAVGLLRGRGRVNKVHFLIVGDPPPTEPFHLERLKARIQEYELSDYFSVSGFVDAVDEVWASTHVAVVPSTEPEPFGMVAVEAMAHGLPVIAAAHGGLTDIVVDGGTGILFEPGSASALADAIERLISDAPLRASLGSNAIIRQADLFSVDQQFFALNKIYCELIG